VQWKRSCDEANKEKEAKMENDARNKENDAKNKENEKTIA
jgi:hypothetical protein